MGKRLMNKVHNQPSEPRQVPKKSSKRKYVYMGALFVICALVLKRDAH